MKRTWILCLIGLFYLGSVASSQAQQTGGIEKAVAALEEHGFSLKRQIILT